LQVVRDLDGIADSGIVWAVFAREHCQLLPHTVVRHRIV
jgi:hypothetical protein